MKKKRIVPDNRGFSFVELIVVVLITGILMLAVVAFISTSRSAYQTVNTSATLQEEAISVERVLTEFIREAKECGYEENISANLDVFWIKARENELTGTELTVRPDSVYFFVLDKANEKMLYYKGEVSMIDGSGKITSAGKTTIADECTGEKAKYCLLGNHVSYMKPKKYMRSDGSELICLDVTYNYMGKEYKSTITAATRNKEYTEESSESGGSISGEPTGG
jgi:prepilin-type N-terminal cleavage/methylation domain-containing protein